MVRVLLARAALAAAIIASAVTLASCSSHHGVDAWPFALSAAPGRAVAPIVPSAQLILTASELPPGLAVIPITPEQIAAARKTAAEQIGASHISPPECQPPQTFDDSDSAAQITAADINGSHISETVAPVPAELNVPDKFFQRCTTVTIDSIQSGKSVHQVSHVSPVDVPRSAADKQVGYQMTSDITFDGTSHRQDAVTILGKVGAYMVTVFFEQSGTGTLDTSLTETVYLAAVAKVAKSGK